jgi:hypothetical protein
MELMMKKVLCMLFMGLLLVGVTCGPALADYTQTFNDTTYVRQAGTQNWMDVVGDANHYNILYTSVTWSDDDVTIKIRTNNNGNPLFPSLDKIADVAIDLDENGVWDTGIVLKDHIEGTKSFTAGQVYSNLANTNWNFFPTYGSSGVADSYDTNNTPGGPYNPANIPLLLNSGNSSYNGSVSWPASSPTDIIITLNDINTDGSWNSFKFLWASETCGNDTQSNNFAVPLPGAVLLLGAGMVRLVAYARRREE